MTLRFESIICALCTILALFAGTTGRYTMGAEQERAGTGATTSGRKASPIPEIARPVMFNTPEADRILSSLQVFPPDNPWNEDISKRPVDRNSRNLIASVGAEKSLAYNLDMGFILVPPNQKRVPVRVTDVPR